MKLRSIIKGVEIPSVLLLICFLSFGLLIPWLGFYWDDLPYTWFYHVLGAGGYSWVFIGDRPFLSVLYIITAPLFGEKPLPWQIFAIFCRWLSVISFWWSLRVIFPRFKRQINWVTFLFAVYPVFSQQWISVIYSRVFILLFLFILSIGCMAYSLRVQKKFWLFYIISVVFSTFALFSSEYFFGLELLRPLVLWSILSERDKSIRSRISSTIKYWAPYLVILIGYSVWRIFFFKSINYDITITDTFSANPLIALLQTAQRTIQTVVKVCFLSWSDAFQAVVPVMDTSAWSDKTTWLILGGVLVVLVGLIIYFIKLDKFEKAVPTDPASLNVDVKERQRWDILISLVGLIFVIFGIIPFWVAGLPIDLVFPWDRFTLALMPGASLFFVGILDLIFNSNHIKIVLISLAISLSVGYQIDKANGFRRAWEYQKAFFWQLAWRVPDLKPDTVLLTDRISLTYYSDNSLSAPLNWIYAPDFVNSPYMPYALLFSDARLGRSVQNLDPGTPVEFYYRTFMFRGNTSQSIAVRYNVNECLKIMDPVYTNGIVIPGQSRDMNKIIQLSDLNLIITDPGTPQLPPQIYTPAPRQDWCYYYEKADLARQMGDWSKIADFGNEVKKKGLIPKIATEWYPFIEGYAHLGMWNVVEELSTNLIKSTPQYKPGLCYTLGRIKDDLSSDKQQQDKLAQIYDKLNCASISENQ